MDVEPPKTGKPPPPQSRLEKVRAKKGKRWEPQLPDVDGCGDLLEWFWDVGPAHAGNALTHTELRAWQDNTGFRLQSWQARLLRRMSQEYLAESHRASDPKCEAPCPIKGFASTAAAIAAASLRASMRADAAD